MESGKQSYKDFKEQLEALKTNYKATLENALAVFKSHGEKRANLYNLKSEKALSLIKTEQSSPLKQIQAQINAQIVTLEQKIAPLQVYKVHLENRLRVFPTTILSADDIQSLEEPYVSTRLNF